MYRKQGFTTFELNSFKDCLFDLSSDGDVLMNYLRLPMSNPILQKIRFLFCVERGVYVGGKRSTRKSFIFFKMSL